MSHLIAAIDESLRTKGYLLCATVTASSDRQHVRQVVRSLLLPGQQRLHATRESDGRRRTLLKSLADTPAFACYIVAGRSRRDGGREQCLAALGEFLLDLGVREFVLERVDPGTARDDVATLQAMARRRSAPFEFRHEAAAHEPILWISDLVVFAYASGGGLRQVADPLIMSVLHLDS